MKRIAWSIVLIVGLAQRASAADVFGPNFGPVAATTPSLTYVNVCDNATPPNCKQVVVSVPQDRGAETVVLQTGTALTPISIWPTPTPVTGTSPTPTPATFHICVVRNPPSNTSSIWVCGPNVTTCVPRTTSGTPGPETGIELRPDSSVTNLGTSAGGCGEYTVVTTVNSLRFERIRQ